MSSHLVPAELPEGGIGGGPDGVVAAEGVPATVAHPDVPPSIRQDEGQALLGPVDHPGCAAI